MSHRKTYSPKVLFGQTKRIVDDSITGGRPKPAVGVEWNPQTQRLEIQYEPVESPKEPQYEIPKTQKA